MGRGHGALVPALGYPALAATPYFDGATIRKRTDFGFDFPPRGDRPPALGVNATPQTPDGSDGRANGDRASGVSEPSAGRANPAIASGELP